MKLSPVELFADAKPGFNHVVAKQVYDAIMKCEDDESAAFMTRAIVFDVLDRDVIRHADFIQKTMDEHIQKKYETIRKNLAREYVTRRMQNKDIAELAKLATTMAMVMQPIAKADDFQDRSLRASKQRRAESGRFVQESTKIAHSNKKPIEPALFNQIYATNQPTRHNNTNLTPRQLRHWQDAYQQISDLVEPYVGMENTFLHITNRGGEKVIPLNSRADIAAHLDANRRATSAKVSVVGNPGGNQGKYYPMFAAAGEPRVGAMIHQNIKDDKAWAQNAFSPEGIRGFAEAQNKDFGNTADQPGRRMFNRLETGSALITNTLGDNAPPKVKAALTAGQWVGEYGPEAQRVLGPTATRTAYRYRGVEKKPDAKLNHAFVETKRLSPGADAESFRNSIIYGVKDDKGVDRASPVIGYFRDKLPTANRNALHQMAGNIPPSQGIVIDSKGRVVTQAHGYGDDWYLPFNLKNVGRLRGGEYIRTRTFGGPTTEDIYTGLMAGANSMTVVSHNGVYTVDFDPNFKGGRRYNDKAARMVSRYAHLLDAVQSEQVPAGSIDPSRMNEIRDEAERNVGTENEKDYTDEIKRIQAQEVLHPKLSAQQREKIQDDVIAREAAKVDTPTGAELTPDEYRVHLVGEATRKLLSDVGQLAPGQLQDFQRNAIAQFSTNQGIIDYKKLGDKVERAEEHEVRNIKDSLSPLKLNGQGYKTALDALKEQFPYYIQDVKFRRWDEAENRQDTGYVRPHGLRPASALSGFFNAGADVRSRKVYADTVYNANGAQTYRRGKGEDEGEEKAEQKNGATSTTSTTRNGAKKASAPSALTANESYRALAEHLIELGRNGTIRPDTLVPGVAGTKAANNAWLRDPNAADATPEQQTIARVLRMSPSELDTEIPAGPLAFKKKVIDAADQIENYKIFEVDKKLLAQARNDGALPEAKHLNMSDPSEALDNPNAEWANLGHAYDRERPHDKADLENRLKEDSDIQALAKEHKLPALESADMDDVISNIYRALRTERVAMDRDPLVRESDKRALNHRIIGAVKVNRARERWKDADRREKAAPAGIPGVTQQGPSSQMVITSVDDLMQRLKGLSPSSTTEEEPAVPALENDVQEAEVVDEGDDDESIDAWEKKLRRIRRDNESK